jgi:hypothetical protein
MKLKNDIERRIFAAAYVRIFQDAHDRGPQPCHRAWAEEEGRDVVECWEKTIAATAIDEANATVRLYRAGLREWKHD